MFLTGSPAALKKNGVLIVVLQLSNERINNVSETPYTSLKRLNSIMKLISKKEFRSIAKEADIREIEGETVVLESGKSFYIGT